VSNVLSNILKRDRITFKEITSGPYAFIWYVADKGYDLVDETTHRLADETKRQEEPGPWLIPHEKIDGVVNKFRVNNYTPLQKPILHRKFSELYNEKVILDFADKYGLLDQPKTRLIPSVGGGVHIGESVKLWEKEITDMGGLLTIWDLVLKRDAGKLGQFIIWTEHTVQIDMVADFNDTQNKWEILMPRRSNIYLRNPKKLPPAKENATWQYFRDNYNSRPRVRFNGIIGSAGINSSYFNRWGRGEVIEPARHFVIREVNERLKGHLDLRLLVPDQEYESPSSFYLFPHSLRSALWVMALMELTAKTRLRQCDICGEWKEVQVSRNPFYCGDACKQAAYRKRKELAMTGTKGI
jgi:hypothetical protein